MEVKFSHVADTHLGARNFKLDEREKDFYKAFEDFIKKSLRENVNFVVHSGDLFEKSLPNPSSLLVAIEGLKKLKENDIPVFIIPGNHDISYQGRSIISVLDSVGLVKNLASSRYFKEEGNISIHVGERFGDIFLAGIPGKRHHIEIMYKRFYPKFGEEKFRIFLFHHSIDLATKYYDIPHTLLPKGFDYYAGGHWHIRFEREDLRIFYPGSTEFWNVDEMKRNEPKGFFVVKVWENGFEKKFVEIETRKIKKMELNCEDLSPIEVTNKAINLIKSINGENSIGILRLYGRLREGNRLKIRRDHIIETAKKFGFLYVHIEDNDLLNPKEPEIRSIENKTIEEIEREYLEKRFSEREVKIAQLILDYLGKDLSSIEEPVVYRKIAEIIKKEFEI